jgi:hypothetical protein
MVFIFYRCNATLSRLREQLAFDFLFGLLFGFEKRRIIEPGAIYAITSGFFCLAITPVIVVISSKIPTMMPIDIGAFLLLLMSPIFELMKG